MGGAAAFPSQTFRPTLYSHLSAALSAVPPSVRCGCCAACCRCRFALCLHRLSLKATVRTQDRLTDSGPQEYALVAANERTDDSRRGLLFSVIASTLQSTALQSTDRHAGVGTQVQIYNPELVLVWSAVVSNLKERVRNVYAPPHSPVSDRVGRRVLLHPLLARGLGIHQ